MNGDHLHQRGGSLLDADAALLDFGRQHRLGERDAVLYVDGGNVRIGADGEGDGQRVGPVGAARRFHVEHVVDADDLALERLGDRCLDHVRACAGIARRDADLRRDDVGKLRDR